MAVFRHWEGRTARGEGRATTVQTVGDVDWCGGVGGVGRGGYGTGV